MRSFFNLAAVAVPVFSELQLPCCCGASCEEGSCSSEHPKFQVPCQKLERRSCEAQAACTWQSPEPCEDCDQPDCTPNSLEKYLEGFAGFRHNSAAIFHMIKGDAIETFNEKEKELQESGGAKVYRERMRHRQGVDQATDAMLWISDASMKVLNCWANDGRFWYVHVWHPGLGVRASTMCVPNCCNQEEVAFDLAAPYFNSIAKSTTQKMANVTAKEVSHWADLPVEFVLIGLDGCGTTSLRRNLAKHPDLNFTNLVVFGQDEDYFFIEMARQTLPFVKQVELLVKHRAQMRSPKVGVYNPLMWKEELLEHLLANIPNLRVVVAVCDPMDRFERKLDLEMARMSTGGTGDIENQLQQFVHDNLRSIYFAPAIRSWFLNFPSQILFIEKDMQHAPETLQRITDFFGIRLAESDKHILALRCIAHVIQVRQELNKRKQLVANCNVSKAKGNSKKPISMKS